jgi:hypothetical protein
MARITTEDRKYLQMLCFRHAKLTNTYYYLQALALWYRIMDRVPHEHYRVLLAVCLNLTVHFLGPQDACHSLTLFRPGSPTALFDPLELRRTHKALLGYDTAAHLLPWKVARSIQWHVFLNLLGGRVQ